MQEPAPSPAMPSLLSSVSLSSSAATVAEWLANTGLVPAAALNSLAGVMLNELKDLPVDDLVGIGMSKIQAQMLLRRVQAIPPIVLAGATGNDDSSSSRSSSNISTTTTTI